MAGSDLEEARVLLRQVVAARDLLLQVAFQSGSLAAVLDHLLAQLAVERLEFVQLRQRHVQLRPELGHLSKAEWSASAGVSWRSAVHPARRSKTGSPRS